MRYFYGAILVLIGLSSHSQVLDCNRYSIFDLKDTVVGTAAGVYFKMTTDTNSTNSGYTDMFFVDQFSDTLNVHDWWGSWLPSADNNPNDTVQYVLYYRVGVTQFPSNFNGHLVCRNPDCTIPFNNTTVSVDRWSLNDEAIVVYPNPTQTSIAIDAREFEKHITHIELYNMPGSLVLVQKDGLEEIDLTHIESGTYLLRIFSGVEQVLNKKIIKK